MERGAKGLRGRKKSKHPQGFQKKNKKRRTKTGEITVQGANTEKREKRGARKPLDGKTGRISSTGLEVQKKKCTGTRESKKVRTRKRRKEPAATTNRPHKKKTHRQPVNEEKISSPNAEGIHEKK